MLSIPNPCPKKWNDMTPAQGGNFCSSCERIVVDFSECNNDEILEYLRNANGKRVCGRLRFSQVVQPRKTFQLARFTAALFFVFSFALFSSCKSDPPEHVVGDVEPVPLDSAELANRHHQMLTDSIANANAAKARLDFVADSTRIADSVERTKNHVRDFQ